MTKVPKKAACRSVSGDPALCMREEYCIYINDDDYGLYKKDGTKVAQPFGMAIQKAFGDSGQIKMKISKTLLDNIPAIRYTIATFDPNAVNSDSLWQGGSSAVDVYPGTSETFGGEINGYGQISTDGILTVTEYTIYYIYNGIEPIAEYSSDGSLLARYVYAGGRHIAKIAGADTTWYHCDALGSPRKMTNESGSVTWTGAYYPFGEMLTGSGNLHGFTGKELDSEMGLNYFCQRYYDPQIGRFMNLDEWTCLPDDQRNFSATAYLSWNSHRITYDPKPMQANQTVQRSRTDFDYDMLPDAVMAVNRSVRALIVSGPLFMYNSGIRTLGMIHQLNRYQYCYNNPLKYIDPTGNWLDTKEHISFMFSNAAGLLVAAVLIECPVLAVLGGLAANYAVTVFIDWFFDKYMVQVQSGWYGSH